MEAVSKREKQQLDLDSLDRQALKALVLAKQTELDSRDTGVRVGPSIADSSRMPNSRFT
jgi:hypothetical protein